MIKNDIWLQIQLLFILWLLRRIYIPFFFVPRFKTVKKCKQAVACSKKTYCDNSKTN